MNSGVLIPIAIVLTASFPAAAADEKVTFNKHIAPILFNHCASCHRPGEVAPFNLLTYKDAAKRAEQLVEATTKKVMPPWKAEVGYGDFRDVRILTQKELELLATWSKTGALEGDPLDLPASPKFPDDWPLGKPDLVVRMAAPFAVPAEGPDQIHVIPLKVNLPEDKMVTAIDVRPGNRFVVHHALVAVDNIGFMRDRSSAPKTGDLAPKANEPGGLGVLAGLFQLLNGSATISPLGTWVPGTTPRFFSDGYGMKLPKDARVVLQMHYHPVGKAGADQSEVAFYFAKKPDVKPMHGVFLAGLPLSIPAGEKRHRISKTITLPVDATLHSIGPHMHQVGKEMKVTATLPDGKTEPLIWIKDWDWNWQGRYVYKNPLNLPKGTKIDLEAYYDNSADNPFNPNRPPKAMKWGEQSSDEMCLCFLLLTTAQDSDADTLRRSLIEQHYRGFLTNKDR